MDLTAFQDELEKIAWLGTYYHGTSPTAEKSILEGGLKASLGSKGEGAVEQLAKAWGRQHPVVKKFRKETAGKVTMSRSKTLAKIYGLVGHRKEVGKALREARRGGGKAVAQEGLRQLLQHQPLEISGKSLKGLKRDPSHFFLAVQTPKDVPASMIRKAKPSTAGKMLMRVLARK